MDCKERDGVVNRTVYKMPRDLKLWLEVQDKMNEVNNFLSKSMVVNTEMLLDEKNQFYLIDDVGVAVVLPYKEHSAHVHITFWDRRLRGKEELMKKLAEHCMAESDLQYLFTAIPTKAGAVIAFAKRVGFKIQHHSGDHLWLNFC